MVLLSRFYLFSLSLCFHLLFRQTQAQLEQHALELNDCNLFLRLRRLRIFTHNFMLLLKGVWLITRFCLFLPLFPHHIRECVCRKNLRSGNTRFGCSKINSYCALFSLLLLPPSHAVVGLVPSPRKSLEINHALINAIKQR